MTTTDIIKQICSETGIDFIGNESLDLVPFNDLNVHKTEVWSLTITNTPEEYFLKMDHRYKNKVGYRFKFPISSPEHGIELCKGLSYEFGIHDMKIPTLQTTDAATGLYLAVHIHPEFVFTQRKARLFVPTQELKMCFV